MAKGWYIVNTLSGHENKVKINIEKRILQKNLQDKIFQIKVPTVDVTELKGGKRKTVKKKYLPGYVMVEMEAEESIFYEILSVPGVSKFMGIADEPKPLSPQEVENLFQQIGEAGVTDKMLARDLYEIGEQVRVIDGPFSNFVGTVEEVIPDKNRLRIRVEIFGRSTPVELNFNQIGKI